MFFGMSLCLIVYEGKRFLYGTDETSSEASNNNVNNNNTDDKIEVNATEPLLDVNAQDYGTSINSEK